MKHAFILIFSFILLSGCAYPDSSNFTVKANQWTFYGDGIGSIATNIGVRKGQSSAWLSTDWGETETAFNTWKGLSPGFYKVITYVHAKDVQPASAGASFWHFYDGGYGTISPFMDLHGDYGRRKIEYTIKVKSTELTVWFRLKSPGQIWIEDFSIEKVVSNNEKIFIETPAPSLIQETISLKDFPVKMFQRKKLYYFDKEEYGHPFTVKNKAGEFSPQKFYNFKIEKLPIKDWTNFDRLEMDVFNPNNSYCDFTATLGDDLSSDYWSELNLKQTLAPGWNKLNFSLTQLVGERGSHRFYRPINLAKIKKFFIVIDPDSKSSFLSKSFLIKNIILTSNPMPAIPSGVMAFDFTSTKAINNDNLIKVTTQTGYNDQRGYGFVEPKFWRVEDSQYASESLRYTIGLLDGHFKIKLPNGKYQINLILDKLGYWDIPFWSDRTVYINETPIFKETRNSERDFLNDILRFENIIPNLQDHPYDLYLSKIFHSINKTVEVNNGFLDFEFKGDATGISLNSLILWNKRNEGEGIQYKKAFEKRNKDEFDWMSRPIFSNSNRSTSQNFSITLIEPDLYLNPGETRKSIGTKLNFLGGEGDTPYQMIQLNPGNKDEKISWSFENFINEKNETISKNELGISDLVFQYTSPDFNHETYLLTGKYLKPFQDHSVLLLKNQTKYLWLQLKINAKMHPGLYTGEVVFHRGNELTKFPLMINVLSYSLPKLDFPVGFFGLDPLPYSYFSGNGYNELRKKYRYLALDSLGEAGFTTFTGLPSDKAELDELFNKSSKWGMQTVFSYGGQFPQTKIDLSNKPIDMSENEYYSKVASELKGLLNNKNWPKIVHTFSDEAGGYSDKMTSDIDLGKKLKKYFPFMALGGFGSFHSRDSNKLNALFDYGFYSSLSKSDISKIKENGSRFGFYNTSAGNLDDPRFSFGLGLYIARLNGLSQYLEWHSSAFNNYPYYDFDGRESDAVMFYPTSDGKLLHTLRFEFASEGLHAFKKLKLLESAILSNTGNREVLNRANAWLESLRKEHSFYSSTTFMNSKNVNFREFESKLDEHLNNLFRKKNGNVETP